MAGRVAALRDETRCATAGLGQVSYGEVIMKPKPTHSFVKRPNNQCVWCRHPRKAHLYEIVKNESGEFTKVAIKKEARHAS